MRRYATTSDRPDESGAHGRRGHVTVLAVVVVSIVFVLCVGFLQISHVTTRGQGHAVDVKNAFYLAEAGLAEAYAGLAVAKTGNVGTPEQPAAIGDGLFWVEATELAGDRVQLESTGVYGRGRATLGLVVERAEAPLGDLGMFVSDDVSLNPDTLIDSYDSSQGTYPEQAAAGVNNDQAIFGSNGNVKLSSGDVIRGDVHYGQGFGCSVGGGTVTGSIQERTTQVALPPVEVPDYPLGPGVTADDPVNAYVLPPGEYGIESLNVLGRSRAVITGPAKVVIGTLQTKVDSLLTFDTRNGPVEIYVTDSLDLGSGSSAVTVSSKPLETTIQVSGTANVFLGAKSQFHGRVYAPESQIKVAASFEVYGGLIAKSLNLAAQGKLHMDLNLATTRDDVLPTMWSWRVVDIPDAVASKGWSASRLLGVDPATLPLPSTAHEDQWLSLTYEDLKGAVATYEGMESGFDWTQVSKIVSGSRDGASFQPVPEPGGGGGTKTAPPDPSKEPPAEQKPLTAEEKSQIDMITSATSSGQLKKDLLALTPLTDPVLSAAITTDPPPLTSPDLKQLLLKNSPLSDPVIMDSILDPDFAGGALKYVLVENSPLSAPVLEAALVRDPPLSATDLNEVLAAQ